jgi:ABC-type branched-subunit amino acid transport system ATPase component
MSLLEVDALHAGYGRLEILQGVSLSVSPGEIVGVIGPNGAGKSTLLKAVFGYLRPFEGSIRFEGQPITGVTPDRIMRKGLGYVAQAGGIFPDMSVRENLALGGYALASRRAVAQAVGEVLERFPLFRERQRQRAGSLSGGEQRALAIARTLLVKPRLLILDEPSAALAPRVIDEIYGVLTELNRAGIALLVVEQNVAKALELAHRVVVLDMGRNAFAGTASELRASPRIRRLYLGEDRVGP